MNARPFFCTILVCFSTCLAHVLFAQTPIPPPIAAGNTVGGVQQTSDTQKTPATLEPLSPQIQTPTLPSQFVRQSVVVAQTTQPPKIDGSLDDTCWKTATHIFGFYPYSGTAPFDKSVQVEAWLCADKTHLYVAFHCLTPDGKIEAAATQRNSDVTHDDFVGMDIDSQESHRDYSTFLVNAIGTQEEVLEGGTASNITWAGDWTAASKPAAGGYTIEISIPFALMRYPKGAKSFGILLYRHLVGQQVLEAWPYVPISGATNNGEGQYMADFTGIAPPFYSPRPTFLPYVLATAGDGNSVREGIDIKYPLTTTITGVASLYPDFQTIEQAVTSINFTYTQKLLTDNRPFFAEGANFLPDSDLFYSRSIGEVDQGLKIVGKDGPTTVGLLGTTTQGNDGQSDVALNMRKDIGALSDIGMEFVGDNQDGVPSNRVGRIIGGYGFKSGRDQITLNGFHTQSYEDGLKADGSDYLSLSNDQGVINQPYYSAQYYDIGPNFVSDLGYVPEVNKRGTAMVLGQTNIYQHGPLQTVNVELDADQFEHHTGGFFHSDGSLTIYAATPGGTSVAFVPVVDQYEQFHDHYLVNKLQWGNNTLYQQGELQDNVGKLDGQSYNFLTGYEGVLISTPFSAQFNYSRLQLGSSVMKQEIATGTYRLSDEDTVGGRIVVQSGQTDLYLSFGRDVRRGTDVYVLFGNPNAPSTVGDIAVELVRPY